MKMPDTIKILILFEWKLSDDEMQLLEQALKKTII